MSPASSNLDGSPGVFAPAIMGSLRKLDPRRLAMNPVALATEFAAAVATVAWVAEAAAQRPGAVTLLLALGLWLQVLLANYAEAVEEARGRAHAARLRRSRGRMHGRRLHNDLEERVPASDLRRDDIVVCESGDIIPADGEVVEGIASVDESAITGESALVIRESGTGFSAVTGGTLVLSNRIVVRVTSESGGGFLDHLAGLVESPGLQPTPPAILRGVVAALAVGLLVAGLCAQRHLELRHRHSTAAELSPVVALVLVASLLPGTLAGLGRTLDLGGVNRLVRHNVIPSSTGAVEAAGRVDVMLLKRAGTVTFGDRRVTGFLPAPGVAVDRLAEAAQLASLADETPEGRSIVVFAKARFGLRPREVTTVKATYIPFSPQTRMSGIDLLPTGERPARRIRKGEAGNLRAWIEAQGSCYPSEVAAAVEKISRTGGTALVVAENGAALGVVHLEDPVKGGLKERLAELRRLGVHTIMTTGDNQLAAAAIAAESGVDEFLAQATAGATLKRIRDEQAAGHVVAMAGDGGSDAPALAQADVGVAMNSGTQAAREAGNMIDLDSNPIKLIEIVRIGRGLAGARGWLAWFSRGGSAAKYAAVVPAFVFGIPSGGLSSWLNFLALHSPDSAVLGAVFASPVAIGVFLAFGRRRGTDRAAAAGSWNTGSLLLAGAAGAAASLAGIKAADVILAAWNLV
jgi:K+-transporting ATPase ATPase B chain